jgi:hypothetical protein
VPSAVLVQERTEAKLEDAGLGVRIVSVESTVDSISVSAGEGRKRGWGSGPFVFDVHLSEESRTDDRLSLRYSFTFAKPSSGQACKVSGRAAVRFSRFNPSRDFNALGHDITNEMTVEIFRKNYETVYLLHESLGMDVPSPWITHDVSLSSRNSADVAPSGNP